jgi:hypothetical protein
VEFLGPVAPAVRDRILLPLSIGTFCATLPFFSNPVGGGSLIKGGTSNLPGENIVSPLDFSGNV